MQNIYFYLVVCKNAYLSKYMQKYAWYNSILDAKKSSVQKERSGSGDFRPNMQKCTFIQIYAKYAYLSKHVCYM